ncbi:MAG: Uma2 family endonuclease [Raineya sp.]|nr:Uma2 family endonuclease [Raineya sp.]
MSAVPKETYISPQDYLARERLAKHKSEYYQGEIFAMAGASFEHNEITANLLYLLKTLLKGKSCRPYPSDLRIHIPERDFYTYPDVSVLCGEPEFTDDIFDTITNPVVIVEVLSESTADYDRGAKFRFYQQIRTLQHYILVSSWECYVEVFTRKKQNLWELQVYQDMNESCLISYLDIALPLQEIYENVKWIKK